MPKLIIQVPCFNEAQALPVTLAALPRVVAGFDAVEWLGTELLRRGLESQPVPVRESRPARTQRGEASLSWVSQHGHRWMHDYRTALHRPLFPYAG